MPAQKHPRRVKSNWGTYLKPGDGDRGGIELLLDKDLAIQKANEDANLFDQHRFVIQY